VSKRAAIVTLALGSRYRNAWRRRCRANWEAYAGRHGYDVLCLEQPLDRSARARSRSPAWQKCLILGQPFARRYERIVWMDADVLINPAAPSIVDGIPVDMVGAVDEYATPTPEAHRQNLRKLYRHWEETGVAFIRNETAREYYAAYGLADGYDAVVQTGVMVLSPAHHRPALEEAYHAYEDRGPAWNYEMRPLSYELLKRGCVAWLDPRFNYIWGNYKSHHFPFLINHPRHPRAVEAATQALHDVFCLHFAGSIEETMLARDEPPAPRAAAQRAARPRRADNDRDPTIQVPVVMTIFARPDTTRRVLDAVRVARPPRLLVVADAPRPDREDDAANCAAARAVIERVDWECEVQTNFADAHMGLKRRVESGLSWAFELVEEAIVLEDDCLPHPTFFGFCEELLDRFRDDPRVMAISGDNLQSERRAPAYSYAFSRYPQIWGWATWRRAWRHYDPGMSRWPALRRDRWLEELFDDPHAVAYWSHQFDLTHRTQHTWDHGWLMACWLAHGLCATPSVNLVSNLGFRADGTHTSGQYRSPFSNIPVEAMAWPLRHPDAVSADADADRFIEDVMFSGNVSRMFERLRAARRLRAGTAP
jgi:hypothetical protein